MTEYPLPTYVDTDTVAGLIEWLQQCPPDAKVRLIPAQASGVSDRVSPRLSDGMRSRWGYDLPADQYRRVDEVVDTYPVVWIR